MDFGLAQLSGGTKITKTETVLGTPAYMSPEQAQRLETNRRTDIWSLGVVLYEMVTGRLPFEGERESAVLHSIIHEPHEPITAFHAGVPLELDRIVGKALAKNLAHRYQHLDDMLVDLRALRGNLSATRITGSRVAAWPRRWLWVRLAPRANRHSLPRAAGDPRSRGHGAAAGHRAHYAPGSGTLPNSFSRWNHVAFTSTGPRQDNTDIYVQQIGAGSPMRLTTDPRSEYNPVWSPDGRWIAFLRGDQPRPTSRSGRELRLIAPLGGPERKLADVIVLESTINPVYLAWCPDSRCLVLTDTTGEGKPALFVISVEPGEKRHQLTNPHPPVLGDTNPAFSPDDGSLLFMRRSTLCGFRAKAKRIPGRT